MSKLCQDEEAFVRSTFYKKLYKGMARQHGKLPFKFASLFALSAHDVDGKEGEGLFLFWNLCLILSPSLCYHHHGSAFPLDNET
jgi:hypothetical protein